MKMIFITRQVFLIIDIKNLFSNLLYCTNHTVRNFAKSGKMLAGKKIMSIHKVMIALGFRDKCRLSFESYFKCSVLSNVSVILQLVIVACDEML